MTQSATTYSPPEAVRLTKRCRDQLVSLKRKTGIKNWNVLARWGLATSLALGTQPPELTEPAGDGVEMSWSVFAGSDGSLLWAALLVTSPNEPRRALLAHIHRGISQLASSKGLSDIVGTAVRVGSN